MDKIIEPTKPVQGAAAGAVATVDLAIGPRYHTIWIEAIATAAAGATLTLADFLGLIAVKVNGKTARQFLATELDAIQTSYGAVYAANILNYDGDAITYVNGVPQAAQAAKKTMCQIGIRLAEPWRKSYAAQEMLAWYTAWQNGTTLNSFSLDITCGPSTNWLANSTILLRCYAEVDQTVGPVRDGQPIALITKWNRRSHPYTGTGELNIPDFLKRGIYNQISLFMPGTDTIGSVKVKKNAQMLRDVTKIRNDQTLIGRDWNESGLPATRFDIGFDYADLPTDGLNLNGVLDFQVIPNVATAAAANNMVSICQVYEQAEF